MARLQIPSGTTSQALTASGEIFGSPYYMSPEQTTGEEMDARSDIYSLGCSLFETLTGRVPFAGPTAIQTLMMHQDADSPAPSSLLKSRSAGPTSFDAFDLVVARCLQKEAKQRYQSAEQLAVDLQRIIDGKPIGNAARISDLSHELRTNAFMRDDSNHEDRELVDDDIQASKEGSQSPFIKHGKLAVPLLSLASVALAASAFLAMNGEMKRPVKPIILRDVTAVGIGISDDVALKMNENLKKKESEIKAMNLAPPQDLLTEDNEFASTGDAQQRMIDDINALLNKFPRFSQGVKTIGGHAMRCFKFPREFSIGRIKAASEKHIEAQGELKFPAEQSISLHLGSKVSDYPKLVDKFAPEDIASIRLENHSSVGKVTERLKRWTRLTALTIDGGNIKDSDLASFDKIKNLDFLWLKRLRFDYKKFVVLDCLNRIEDMQLEDCPQVNDILMNLHPMPKLAVLSLEGRGNDWIEPAAILAISRHANLKTLSLKTKRNEIDTFAPLEGAANTDADQAAQDPIFTCRHELAKLKGVSNIRVEKPTWTKEMKLEFGRVLPAARGNSWAKELDFTKAEPLANRR
ncbi:hypothetical protein BH11CYA1_BH11CYA1_42870 [soil metagenome]